MHIQHNNEAHSRIIVTMEKKYKYYLLSASVRAHACMWVCRHVGICMHLNACSLANLACNVYVPYHEVICGTLVFTQFFDIIS
jgi:hypothetical protein